MHPASPQYTPEIAGYGGFGYDVITDTAEHVGPYGFIQPVGGDAVIGSAKTDDPRIGTNGTVASSGSAISGLTGKTLKDSAVYPLYRITALTLSSGAVIAYKLGR